MSPARQIGSVQIQLRFISGGELIISDAMVLFRVWKRVCARRGLGVWRGGDGAGTENYQPPPTLPPSASNWGGNMLRPSDYIVHAYRVYFGTLASHRPLLGIVWFRQQSTNIDGSPYVLRFLRFTYDVQK